MRQAETLETLRMAQHLAPLLGQGGELRCDLVWSCDADLQDLLGFLPGGQAAQGRQVQGDASRLLRLGCVPPFTQSSDTIVSIYH